MPVHPDQPADGALLVELGEQTRVLDPRPDHDCRVLVEEELALAPAIPDPDQAIAVMRWEPHLEVVVKPGRPAGIRFGRHATIGFVPHRVLDDAVAIADRSLGQQRAGPLEVGTSVVLLLETHGVLDCDG